MWTEAQGQNAEQAHVAGIKAEMRWTGVWWAMKVLWEMQYKIFKPH